MKSYIVYEHKNLINQKIYIGITSLPPLVDGMKEETIKDVPTSIMLY